MTWSAAQYTKFEDERTRPVRDLLAAVPPFPVRHAVDLGCGPGNSTELLLARFPDADVSGLDSSADMVEAARRRLPQQHFVVADIATWRPATPPDLLLSNAVLHWLPDHAALLPRLAESLAPGGTLAVQMPDNLDEPAKQAMNQVAAAGPWADRLRNAGSELTRPCSAGEYHRMLKRSCVRVDIWRTTYHHVLPGGTAAVVEWFKGSGLRPYLQPLDANARADFLDRYQAALDAIFPAEADGTVLLPFPRLFIVATR